MGSFVTMTLGTEEEKLAEEVTKLSVALESRRDGLAGAREQGRGRKVRFESSEFTLTIESELPKDSDASAGVPLCVPEAGERRKVGAGPTQTRVVPSTLGLYDDKSNRSRLNVPTDQPRLGR